MPVEEGRYVSTPELMRPLIDENTIGEVVFGYGLSEMRAVAWRFLRPSCQVPARPACRQWQALRPAYWPAPALLAPLPAGIAAVFGSTYNGEFEDVEAMDALCTGGCPGGFPGPAGCTQASAVAQLSSLCLHVPCDVRALHVMWGRGIPGWALILPPMFSRRAEREERVERVHPCGRRLGCLRGSLPGELPRGSQGRTARALGTANCTDWAVHQSDWGRDQPA